MIDDTEMVYTFLYIADWFLLTYPACKPNGIDTLLAESAV